MKCIVCFSEDNYQKELKHKTFGIERFENKIIKYKELYTNEIKNLVSVKECNCGYNNQSDNYIKWTDEFVNNIKNNINIIEETFDELREIYLTYISNNIKNALEKLWLFLSDNNLLNDKESAISYTRLLFRARNKGDYDKSNIEKLFHIPFNKRHLIGNQRFSISGQPMLYLANSIYSVEKELDENIDNLEFATFLPKYYLYYGQKVYEIKNTLFDLLYKSLPAIFDSGSNISYFDEHVRPNYTTIVTDIKKTILSHILTYPTEQKGTFIPEYVLPQMITTALLEHNYKGIIFPSTKNFNELKANKINNEHEINIAFFVKYNNSQNLDTELLNSFLYYTFDGSESFNLTIEDIKSKINSIIEKNKKSHKNNNDFILPLIHTKMYIDYMKTSNINGVNYFETKYGKIELEFFFKMINKLNKYVK